MITTARRPLIVGNWKMHKTRQEALDFLEGLIPLIHPSMPEIYLALPYTLLYPISSSYANSGITFGAQNLNEHGEGPFTGEISASMLKDAGASFVLIGHSERRRHYQESNELISKKIHRALMAGVTPILCVGESDEERKTQLSYDIVTSQLDQALSKVSAEEIKQVIIAYEPVWAIGTHQPASPSIAEEMHQLCRHYLALRYSHAIAQGIRILYGGSVRAENASKMMEEENVDGLLIGNASLVLSSFEKIINYSTPHLAS